MQTEQLPLLFLCHQQGSEGYFIADQTSERISHLHTQASLEVSHSHSAVRLDAPGLRVTAQGVTTGDPSPRWVTPSNPAGTWVPHPAREGSYTLHYGYCRMEAAAAARELMLHSSHGTAKSSQVCPATMKVWLTANDIVVVTLWGLCHLSSDFVMLKACTCFRFW